MSGLEKHDDIEASPWLPTEELTCGRVMYELDRAFSKGVGSDWKFRTQTSDGLSAIVFLRSEEK